MQKKINLLLITLFSIIIFSSFVSSIISYQQSGNFDESISDSNIRGQQFLLNGNKIDYIIIELKKVLTPTGLIQFDLYNDSGSNTFGSLIYSNIARIDVSTLQTSSNSENLTVNGTNNLINNSKYWLKLKLINSSSWDANSALIGPKFKSLSTSNVGLYDAFANISYRTTYNWNMTIITSFITANTPTINSINITPQPSFSEDTLTCNVNSSYSEYEYIKWYVNNQSIDNTCFQEFANESTSCGGLSTGNYDLENRYYYVNYTKPDNFNDVLWQLKHGQLTTYNTTLPDSCFNAYSDRLRLRIFSLLSNIVSLDGTQPQCYNGSDWVNVGNNATTASWTSFGASVSNRIYDGDYNTFGYWAEGPGQQWAGGACTGTNCENSYIYEESVYWLSNNLTSDNFNITDNVTCEATAYNITGNLSSSATNSSTLTIGSALNISVSSSYGTPTTCDFTLTGLTAIQDFSTSGSPNVTNFYVDNGTYNVTADCDGFAISYETLEIENATHSLNFDLFITNSIFITYKDITNNSIITWDNITATFIGESNQSITTSNGTIYIDLVTPDSYTIISTSNDYNQNSYILDLINRTTNNLTIYLTPTNITSLVLITVRDKFSKDPIKNAQVTIQRYTTAWVTDQILNTDFNGQTEGYFVLSTVFYNFLVDVDGVTYFGTINSDTDKKLIFAEDVSNGIIIEIDTNPKTAIPNYQSTYPIITSCTFTNTSNSTGYFLFSYDDTDNIQHDAEFNVYYNDILNCTSSVTATESSIINCTVTTNPANGIVTFKALGLIDSLVVEQCFGQLGVDDVLNFPWKETGWIIGILLIFIGFTSFADVPSLSTPIGTGVFILGILFNLYLGETAIATLILLGFFAFLLSKTPTKGGND